MGRATLKGLLGHKLRLLLTVLAITLGVGFVAGSFVFTDTLGSVFDDLFADTARGVDVNVRPLIELDLGFSLPGRIPEEVLDEVRKVDGVEEATGTIFNFVTLLDAQGEVVQFTGPPTFGVSWPDTSQPGAFTLRDGRAPRGDGEMILDRRTAERLGYVLGDTVHVIALDRPEPYTLVGVAGFGEADNLGGAGFALFELATAQRIFDAQGEYDTIDVRASAGVTPEQLVRRIGPVLPEGFEAVTAQSVAEEQTAALKEGLGFFNTFLLVFAGIALFVGAFIIQNTFRIIVAQRTQELALFRALGATAGQVTTMVITEALLVGVVASAFGLVFGIGLAYVLSFVYEAFGGELPDRALEVQGRTVLVALAVGVFVTLVSALLPANKAASIPPVAAMRQIETTGRGSMRTRVVAGSAIIAAGIGLLATGLFLELPFVQPIAFVGAGAAIVFIGMAVISPVFARPVARTIGAPFPRLLALPGTLARENAMRKPRRTAATAAALMIGLALVSLATILAASFRGTVRDVIDESFRADFVVTTAGFTGFGISPQIAGQIDELPEVELTARMREGQFLVNDSPAFLSAVDPDTFITLLAVEVTDGNFADLSATGVAVQAARAAELDVEVGDSLDVTFAATGDRQLPVVATWEGQGVTGTFIISLAMYEANFTEALDSTVLIKLAQGVDGESGRSALEQVTADFPTVQVLDQTDFREQAESQINFVLSLIFVLLMLSVLVAFLGITNTLSLSIIERTREIGLLRAVGMSRRQVRTTIRWESVIISVFGAALGIVLGIVFGWAVVAALADQGLRFVLPAGQLIGAVVAAGAAGIVAAVIPAWRASRLNVLEAIAYE